SGMGWARGVAAKWARKYPRLRDDFLGEALLALWRCASGGGYHPSRGSFRNWAGRRVDGACADLARMEMPKGFRPRAGRRARAAPARAPFTALRLAADDAPPVGWAFDSEDGVLSLTAGLPPAQRDVLRRRFLDAGAGLTGRDERVRWALKKLAGSLAGRGK
ncbi:MAG TPA: hypothetical protein VM529_11235, partial [Gemmata sp.]|nr:hypothetical protein [Gemmata sp.]